MDLTSAEIGERIRAARKERDWTLQELGRRSGVSLSALSKIENAQVAATFDTLVKVARGLGLGFDALLRQPGERPGTRRRLGGRLAVTRAAEALRFSSDLYDYAVHAGALRAKHMIPLLMHVKARTPTEAERLPGGGWSSHEGEEFVLVVSGSIEMHTEAYEPVRLEAGDSAYLDSGMPHRFLNVGPGEAVMASICTGTDGTGAGLPSGLADLAVAAAGPALAPTPEETCP